MMIDYSRFKQHNVLCLDMKSFFASCECVCRGLSPLDTYLVVIGDKERSGNIVLASTPLVKQKLGIKAGKRKFEVSRLPYIFKN
jgi:DNA polymerase V